VSKRLFDFLLCLLLLILLTGCWDNIAIEERGFVVGSALDKSDEVTDEQDQLILTNQFVIPSGISTNAVGGGTGSSAFTNLSATGDSIFAMDTDMASLTSKMPFFEHLQLLVVSEDLIGTPNLFTNTLDVFIRDKQMRRGVNIIVAKDAKSILDIQPENEKIPTVYIEDLLKNSLEKASLFKPVSVGEIHEHLLTNSSFAIPKIKPLEHEVEYEGAVVYHGVEHKAVGSLDKVEMTGLNLITTKDMHGGTLEFHYEEDLITFQIYNAKSKIKIDDQDPENIKIDINIGVEGGIAEVFGNKSLHEGKNIKGIEKAAAKKIEELVNATVEKAQKELNADIFRFDDTMRQRHFQTWEKIKDNWEQGENYFAESDIQVTGKARVRTAGATDKTHKDKKE